MIEPINKLNKESKVWVFISNRIINESEQSSINNEITTFLIDWTAHNKALFSAFEIKDSILLMVAVDESMTNASGCSIDKLFHFVRELGVKYVVNFFDRLQVVYKTSSGVDIVKTNNLDKLIEQEIILRSTLMLNPLVSNLREYEQNIWIPFSESWLKDHFSIAKSN